MKISIYAPYAKERFETARQHSILHPERIVGNPEVIPRNVGGERALPPQSNSVKHSHGASCAGPRQQPGFKNLSIRMVAGYREIAEIKEFLGCGGLQPSELFSPAFQLPNDSHSRLGPGLCGDNAAG